VVQIHVRARFYLQLMIADWRPTDDSAASFNRKSAIENRKSLASVPQQPQERFRKPLIVGASPTRGSSLVLMSGLWCNSSIFAREANGPGANPGFLTKAFDGA
jgi:hypothetical protein